MSKLILTPNDVKYILWEDHEKYSLVEEGDWTQDCKYQSAEIIFKDNETEKFYSMWLYRSGSYHTDWDYSHEYEDTEAVEVKKVTKTVVTETWEAVNG